MLLCGENTHQRSLQSPYVLKKQQQKQNKDPCELLVM